MLEFRKIEISDRDWINERLSISGFRGCEYSFANNLAWQRLYDYMICDHDGFYINCGFQGGQPVFIFPAGAENNKEGRERHIRLFEELYKYCSDRGKALKICSVTERDLGWLTEYYGGRLTVSSARDDSDYIYKAKDLIELTGKKYHSKRNFISGFKKLDWSCEPVCADNISECIGLAVRSYDNAGGSRNHSAVVEQYAIDLFLTRLDELELNALVLRQQGRLVGFTIGEMLNCDTFVVHIEKAEPTVRGAYQTLCREFAAAYASAAKYINREEDMGIEGLRKAKLSYCPDHLLHKYTLTITSL